MGCFEFFPKVRDSDKKLEKDNPSSSGECSAKGGTAINSAANSGSYQPNSGTNSGANSGIYAVSDPCIKFEVAVDPAVAPDGVVDDSPGTRLSQSGSLRKPNDLRDFTYQELRYATKNFDRKYLLGEGGFGQVFRGTVKQKQKFGGGEEKVDVAVKQLNSRSQQVCWLHVKHINMRFEFNVLFFCCWYLRKTLTFRFLRFSQDMRMF